MYEKNAVLDILVNAYKRHYREFFGGQKSDLVSRKIAKN